MKILSDTSADKKDLRKLLMKRERSRLYRAAQETTMPIAVADRIAQLKLIGRNS